MKTQTVFYYKEGAMYLGAVGLLESAVLPVITDDTTGPTANLFFHRDTLKLHVSEPPLCLQADILSLMQE